MEDSAGRDGSAESFALAFSRLNVARRGGGHTSPHKPCMLLALIDLAEAGDLEENIVRYEPALLERYDQYFAAVRTSSDHPNAYFPFFHLRSEPFWHLVPRPGREDVLDAMPSVGGHRDIVDNVDHAALDDHLHRLLQRDAVRRRLRDVLISRWFPNHEAAISSVLGERAAENDVERALRAGDTVAGANASIRSSVFRRMVLEAYDYRCAATGLRLVVPGVAVLLDAAHLIPFSVSGNDVPTNGIALTPTFHRALDSNLIAPGPDHKWHVSKVLDSRIPDYEPLLSLSGRDVLFYGKPSLRASEEALAWRLERLQAVE